MNSVPENQAPHSIEQHGEATAEGRGFMIAVIFVGFALAMAVLFAVYVLAWNGGAHT